MVNIKLIAHKAGVSISTVSRVMNGSKPVSEDLQNRVLDAVRQMNYKPNSIARSLILNKTNLIGVVVPNVSNSFQAKLLAGIESFAAQAKYGVIICNVYQNLDKQQSYFSVLMERHVDGIILLHEDSIQVLEQFQKNISLPLVFASVQVEGSSIHFVGIDESAAAYDAATCLIRKGHRRIGLINGEGTALGKLRKEGYLKALKQYNIPFDDTIIIQSKCSFEDGYNAMGKMLKLNNIPTAVFCVSDEIAVGALDCVLDHNRKVPEDISIMGFDDIDLSQVCRPKLTTVHQPIKEIGEEAARLLISLIEQRSKTHIKSKSVCLSQESGESQSKIVLKHRLVERETVLERV